MMKQKWGALLLAALIAVTASAIAAEKADAPKNIFVIGWDGAQRNHVNECLQRKELPVLQKLADEGALVEIDIEGTTDTKAGWSQILTGYYPAITGVYSNGKYQCIPEGYSLAERLEKPCKRENVILGPASPHSGRAPAKKPARPPKKKRPAKKTAAAK